MTRLKQRVLRLPVIGSLLRKRHALLMQLRALLRPVSGPSTRATLDGLRRDAGRLLRLSPVFVAQDRRRFFAESARAHLPDPLQYCVGAGPTHSTGNFSLCRFCLCCNETTRMLVDYADCRVDKVGRRTPNWRERLVCSECAMNNRQRLVAKLVQQRALQSARTKIYLMEQVTPIFAWVRNLPGAEVHGSEYLGHEYKGGAKIHGVRHEDVMNLSYPDESFDVIVSNDVLEHIPDPAGALGECFRVLKRGGTVLATFPFHAGSDTTVTRAKLVGRTIEHLLPPQYHGNPLSPGGSLVFHDFGWDLLDVMRDAGFASAVCESYSSDEFGHLGPGLLVFRLTKADSPAV